MFHPRRSASERTSTAESPPHFRSGSGSFRYAAARLPLSLLGILGVASLLAGGSISEKATSAAGHYSLSVKMPSGIGDVTSTIMATAVGGQYSSYALGRAAARLATNYIDMTASSSAPTMSPWRALRESLASIDICGQNASASVVTDKNDCTGGPWPRWGAFQQKLCPWPSMFQKKSSPLLDISEGNSKDINKPGNNNGGGFVNFTAASARRLLRGRTIVINGDSTSRRLMWSLCNFLDSGDRPRKSGDARRMNGDGCCGTLKIDIHCDLKRVLDADILLTYNPPRYHREVVDWLTENRGILKAYGLRNHSGEGLPPIHPEGNNVSAADMPPSLEPRSVHIFHPLAGTWHACRGDSRDGTNWTANNATCGMNRFAGTDADDVEGTACELVRRFCPRFEEAAKLQLPPAGGGGDGGTAPVHMHGLTNVLAYKGGHKHSYYSKNDWTLTVARATHCHDPAASSDAGDGLNAARSCVMSTTENRMKPGGHGNGSGVDGVGYGPFSPRRYIRDEPGGVAISCGYHDQTTWMLADEGASGAARHGCMPSDGNQGIHIYNEYGQLMRMQLLLNQILRTEEEWDSM